MTIKAGATAMMANYTGFQAALSTGSGFTAGFAVITSARIDVLKKAAILNVGLYKDETSFNASDSSIEQRSYSLSGIDFLAVAGSTIGILNGAYNYLATQSDFIGATLVTG